MPAQRPRSTTSQPRSRARAPSTSQASDTVIRSRHDYRHAHNTLPWRLERNDLIEVIGSRDDPIITVPTEFLIRGHVANWAFVLRLVQDYVEESGRLWRVSPRTLVDPQHPVEGGIYIFLRDGQSRHNSTRVLINIAILQTNLDRFAPQGKVSKAREGGGHPYKILEKAQSAHPVARVPTRSILFVAKASLLASA